MMMIRWLLPLGAIVLTANGCIGTGVCQPANQYQVQFLEARMPLDEPNAIM